MTDYPDMREVTLEKFKIGISQYLNERLIETLAYAPEVELHDHTSFLGDQIALQVCAFVWGRDAQEQSHKYPRDWWQAVKERFAPEWFKRRWPIQYTTVKLIARELYPMVAMPEKQHIIHIMKLVEGDAWRNSR